MLETYIGRVPILLRALLDGLSGESRGAPLNVWQLS